MTAKTRTGLNIADARGADAGSRHSQLMKDHRRPGRREGASVHSFDAQDPDSRTSDDAGIADIHQGYAPGPETPPKGEGPELPDTAVEKPRTGDGPEEDT